MILNDLIDLVSKEKRKKERVKVAQKLAVGMGVVAAVSVTTGILFAPKSGKETRECLKKKAVNTVETIKDTIQKKAETVKDSAAHAAKEAYNVIKDVQGKKEIVKKDIKDDYHEMTQDIHKTAEIIPNEFNNL